MQIIGQPGKKNLRDQVFQAENRSQGRKKKKKLGVFTEQKCVARAW